MSIICNTRCLITKLTGIQRYTTEVLKQIPQDSSCVFPKGSFARGFKGHLWEQFVLPIKVTNRDVLWSPSNTGPMIENQVLTLHDVVPLDHPEWLNKNFAKWYRFLLPKLCKKVRHIITISEFSKHRIIETTGVSENKISVIYNGVDYDFLQKADHSLKLPFSKYILALGSIEPRKNINSLLTSWQEIINEIPDDIGLVIVGQRGRELVFGKTHVVEDIPRVHFTGHVEDKYLPSLFKNALFFTYLSIYEGFGLPPLEAMAAGCPVLVGNRTSIPEVVHDCGVLVDPLSIADIKKAMLRYIEDITLRDYYSKLGRTRAMSFNWIDKANETWKVINRYS